VKLTDVEIIGWGYMGMESPTGFLTSFPNLINSPCQIQENPDCFMCPFGHIRTKIIKGDKGKAYLGIYIAWEEDSFGGNRTGYSVCLISGRRTPKGC